MNAMNTPQAAPLLPEEIRDIHAYWRACNYLAAGMIYLRDNPLLKEPLKPEHIKSRLLGHWGASPGSGVCLHPPQSADQKIRSERDLHGRAGTWRARRAGPGLSGRHDTARFIRNKGEDEEGMRHFFKEFSFPGGIGSHCTPETPGSIHEGGELGYSVSHAFGAAYDNPDLLVAVMVGDGEVGNRPAGHLLAFQQVPQSDPRWRGAADPASQRLQDQQPHHPCRASPTKNWKTCSWVMAGRLTSSKAATLEIHAPEDGRSTMEHCVLEIRRIQQEARSSGKPTRPRWPMIVLRTPKGWTGPKEVDGHKVEGFWRAHQVPLSGVRENPAHLATAGRLAAQLQAGRTV